LLSAIRDTTAVSRRRPRRFSGVGYLQASSISDSPVQCPHFSLTAALLSFVSSDLCCWTDLARGRAPLTDHIQGQWNGGKATDQCQSHSCRFALVIV